MGEGGEREGESVGDSGRRWGKRDVVRVKDWGAERGKVGSESRGRGRGKKYRVCESGRKGEGGGTPVGGRVEEGR